MLTSKVKRNGSTPPPRLACPRHPISRKVRVKGVGIDHCEGKLPRQTAKCSEFCGYRGRVGNSIYWNIKCSNPRFIDICLSKVPRSGGSTRAVVTLRPDSHGRLAKEPDRA